MKYKNILGKDFNTKKEAKEYFNSQLYSIEQKIRGHRAVDRHTKFTEDTLIKDSEMKYLYDNQHHRSQLLHQLVFFLLIFLVCVLSYILKF